MVQDKQALIFNYLFWLTGFLLPFDQPWINYALGLLLMSFVLQWLTGKYQIKIQNPLFWLPLSYFLLHCIGMLYTQSQYAGWIEITAKSSFLIFPLFFSSNAISREMIKTYKLFFIAGCGIICLYNLLISFNQYLQHGNMSSFYYVALSKGMHVQYLTIYLNLAILFILEILFDTSSQTKTLKKAYWALMVLFFLVNITLLSSRLATVVSYATILFYTVVRIISSPNYIRYFILAALFAASVLTIDYFVFKKINRFEQVEIFLSENTNYVDFSKTEYNSTTLRIPLWINAYEVIQRNPLFGVGTGDVKSSLDSIYLKNKFTYAHQNHFNPHNQYLQTGVAFGLTGISLLMLMMLIPLYYAIRNRHYLFIAFQCIFLLNMLTESILERQAGIILFCLFYAIFSTKNVTETKSAFTNKTIRSFTA